MNWTPKILATLAVAAAVIVAAAWLGVFGKSNPAPSATTPLPSDAQSIRTNRSALFTRPVRARVVRTNLAPGEVSISDTILIANADDAVDEVLRGDGEPNEANDGGQSRAPE